MHFGKSWTYVERKIVSGTIAPNCFYLSVVIWLFIRTSLATKNSICTVVCWGIAFKCNRICLANVSCQIKERLSDSTHNVFRCVCENIWLAQFHVKFLQVKEQNHRKHLQECAQQFPTHAGLTPMGLKVFLRRSLVLVKQLTCQKHQLWQHCPWTLWVGPMVPSHQHCWFIVFQHWCHHVGNIHCLVMLQERGCCCHHSKCNTLICLQLAMHRASSCGTHGVVTHSQKMRFSAHRTSCY